MFNIYATKIRFALLAISAGLLLPAVAAAQVKLNVGHLKGAHFDLLFVAKDKGLFEKNGLDVNLINLNRPSDHPAGVVSKSLDVGYASPMVLLQANENGLDLVGIGTVSRETAEHPDVALVARKGSNIKTAKDLVGKKIGVSGLNTNMHIMLKRWLTDRGVNPAQVQFVEVPMTSAGDVLNAGNIDAMSFIEPFLSRALDRGVGEKVANFIAEVQDGALMGLWIVNRDWAKANRETVKKFNAAMSDAVAYVKANPAVIAEVEAKYNGFVSKSELKFALDFNPSDFDIWIEVGKQAGVLRNPPDAKSLFFN